MAGAQRIFKEKIRATKTLEKVFRAMELIAASRISKARDQARDHEPYTQVLTRALAAVAAHDFSHTHPFINLRTDTNRVAVVVVTSDRGMAGAYSASVLREADRFMEELRSEGKEPVLYVCGRRGEAYYRFRGVEVERTWTGDSDRPTTETMHDVADTLLQAYLAPAEEGGICEVHVVYTRFESMVRQVVQKRHMLPMVIVDVDEEDVPEGAVRDELGDYMPASEPLYEFEPSAKEVFDYLMPLYVRERITAILLMAAASELASRQQAMHSATENAAQLIEEYTRHANNARQAEITTEITEIVSGADALKQ